MDWKAIFKGESVMENCVKTYLASVVVGIVDYPDEVKVTEVTGEHSTIVELKVAKSDVGKVIGRQGRMADTLRNIIGAYGSKNRKRYVLQIIDAEK